MRVQLLAKLLRPPTRLLGARVPEVEVGDAEVVLQCTGLALLHQLLVARTLTTVASQDKILIHRYSEM